MNRSGRFWRAVEAGAVRGNPCGSDAGLDVDQAATTEQASRGRIPPPGKNAAVVYKCGHTTLKLVFRRWLQKFQHHIPTFVNKDR
jgi:hypothetical protein